jgi:DNA ligase-1
MISRYGNKIQCPDWFTIQLPKDITLDGELWMGRGTFEILTRVLVSKDDISWKNIMFQVFDLPDSKDDFEMRMRRLDELVLPHHAQKVHRIICTGKDHLQECLEKILEEGGEGLMLNKPDAIYVANRTKVLMKVKVSFLILLIIRP